MTYKIVRKHFDRRVPDKVLKTGLTLEEAQEHYNGQETSSTNCTSPESISYTEKHGIWFDAYYEE